MSQHAQLSPEALHKLRVQKRNSTISAIIIALLITALLVAILLFIAISPFFKNEEELISYSEASPVSEEITKPELTNEVQKKPSSPSASISKVIAANTPSPVAIPVPKDNALEPSLDFGSGSDFGGGWGGSGNGDGNAGGGKSTPFGKTGGTGLKGSFYDLKQDPDKKITRLGEDYQATRATMARIPLFAKDFKKIHRADYSADSLKDYYKATVELTFTHLAIPKASANIAPEAFGVENEVEASGWIIVYEGTMTADAHRPIRFTGRFDDVLIVQVNDKVIFDGSWTNYTGKLNERNEINGPSIIHNEMIKGNKFFDIRRGDHIRIIVGESPGGFLGGGLFVAEEGVTYQKNSAGHDILPPFTTQPLTTEDVDRLKSIDYPMELNNVPVFSME